MPREFPRTYRVGELIHRELARLLQKELKDPNIGMITLSGVEVSKDLAYAKIFYTVFGDAQAQMESARALLRIEGFLRRELSHRLRLRIIPNLKFIYDDSQLRGERLDTLIGKAVREDYEKKPENMLFPGQNDER